MTSRTVDISSRSILPPPPPHKPGQPVDEQLLIGSIISALRKEIKAHGTVGELRFTGHGSPDAMYFGKDGTDGHVNLSILLNALYGLQRETGIKIANKISFFGCDTFSSQSPEWVDYFRDMSKRLGAELVGTTDEFITHQMPIPGLQYYHLVSFKDGKVGHFTPSQESFIAPFVQLRLAIDKARDALRGVHYYADWVQCHEGHTQAEGAACQIKKAKLDTPAR